MPKIDSASPTNPSVPVRRGRLTRIEMDGRISRLLDIAAEEFGRFGFGGTSLDHLVRASGVSKTTILRRFGSKEGLFRTLIDRTMVDIHSGLAAVALDRGDPEGTIAAFVETYTRVAIRNPLGHTLLALAILERRAFPELGAMILDQAVAGLRPISLHLAALMDAGLLARGDPMDAAFDLQALMTQGFRAMVDPSGFVDRPGRSLAIARRFLRGWS